MPHEDQAAFYEIWDALDFDKPPPGLPDLEFLGQSHEVDPPASIPRLLMLTGKEVPGPESNPVTALKAWEVEDAAELTAAEVAQYAEASRKLCTAWEEANAALAAAEQQWLDAKARWTVKLLGAYEDYGPEQALLAQRITEYKTAAEAAITARAAAQREAEEAATAQREKELDEAHGTARWAVMRRRPHNGPYADREDLPFAKKKDDIAPMIHTAECRAIKELRRPAREDLPSLVDWQAEPVYCLRAGVSLERLPQVLEALVEGAPPCYMSSGQVWLNRNEEGPWRPARLCGRCRPLPSLQRAMGAREWDAWQTENKVEYSALARR